MRGIIILRLTAVLFGLCGLGLAGPAGAALPEGTLGPVDDVVERLPKPLPGDPSVPDPGPADAGEVELPVLPSGREGSRSATPPTTSASEARPWSGLALGAGLLVLVGAAIATPPFARRVPRPPVESRPVHRSPSDHLTHGIELLARSDFTSAVPHLRQGLRSRPTDPAARYALGAALARSGKVREALVQLDYAIRLNEDYLAILVQDPELRPFTGRPDVYKFIRGHAARYNERTRRGFA